MGRKILAATVAVLIVTAASQAMAINLCAFGTIDISVSPRGSALIGTAGPMPCDGTQTVFAMGSFTRVANGYFFDLYFDQTPNNAFPISCIEGWELVGVFSGGQGTGTWYNTPDDTGNGSGPISLSLGGCSPLKSFDAVDPLAAVPGGSLQ